MGPTATSAGRSAVTIFATMSMLFGGFIKNEGAHSEHADTTDIEIIETNDEARLSSSVRGWIVLPALRLLSCAIEKNAITLQNALAHVALGKGVDEHFYWNLRTYPKSDIETKLFNRDWRSALVWRDPVERWISAYMSKCGLRDHDGVFNCHRWLGLHGKGVPTPQIVLDALRRKFDAGEAPCKWNAHWAPQHCFCGLDDFRLASAITNLIPFHEANRGLALFYAGRVSSQTGRELQEQLQNTTVVPPRKLHGHRTYANSTAIQYLLKPWMLEEIRRLYKTDFMFLQRLCTSHSLNKSRLVWGNRASSSPSSSPDPLSRSDPWSHPPRLIAHNGTEERKKYFLVMLVLIHNEARILVEFVNHHLNQGVDHFYFIDDESTDQFEQRLAACGIKPTKYSVYRRSFGRRKQYRDQRAVLDSMIDVLRAEATWGAIVDSDEFLVPRATPERTIRALLSMHPMSACHAIAVPWLLFSRGNVTEEPIGNVRFTFRWRWGLDKRYSRIGNAPRKFRNRIGRIEAKAIFQTEVVKSSTIHGVKFRPNFKGCVCTPHGKVSARNTLNQGISVTIERWR
jgi:hypothetical protein